MVGLAGETNLSTCARPGSPALAAESAKIAKYGGNHGGKYGTKGTALGTPSPQMYHHLAAVLGKYCRKVMIHLRRGGSKDSDLKL